MKIIHHLPTHYRRYYYLPVIAACVVAFLFPSGRSSGQKKTKTKPVTPTESSHSGEIPANKKTAWETLRHLFINSTTITKLYYGIQRMRKLLTAQHGIVQSLVEGVVWHRGIVISWTWRPLERWIHWSLSSLPSLKELASLWTRSALSKSMITRGGWYFLHTGNFESMIDGVSIILLIGLIINYTQTCKSSLVLKSNFKRNYKKILSTSGPLHCAIVPELPSCLHSASPSPSFPHSTHGSLCLLAGPGALLWLQLFRCTDADPVWDHWSLLSHVDLPPSNTRTEVNTNVLIESYISLHSVCLLHCLCGQYLILMLRWYLCMYRTGLKEGGKEGNG